MAEPQEVSKPVKERDIVGYETSGDAPATAGKPQRISIAPVERKVMLDEPAKVEVSTEDPVLGVQTTTTTLEPAAAQDIAAQEAGVAWEDVLAGNVPKLGDLNINERVLDFANKNPEAMVELRARWVKHGQAIKAGEEVQIPFARRGEVVAAEVIKDPMLVPAAERYAQNRINLDNMLSQYVPDPTVRQIFVDQFETGDFYSSLETRLAEAGQFMATGPAMGYVMGKHALGAYLDSKEKGTDWSAEWGARSSDIQQDLDTAYNYIDKAIPRPTMKMAFNDGVHERLKKQLDDGTLTEDQYNNIAMIELEDGTLQRKEFITDEAAGNLIDLAFNELPKSQQFGVMFVENVLGMVGPGTLRSARTMRKFEKLKQSYAGTTMGKLLKDVDDPFEAAQIINQADGKAKINLKAMSIAVSQQRSMQAMGRLNNELREVDLQMDDIIRKGGSKTGAEYKTLEGRRQTLVNRKMQSLYTLRAFPYVRENVEDALVISAGQLAAREYLPQMFDGMEPATAEAFGMMGMVLGGHQTARYVGSKVANFTASPRGGVGASLANTVDFLTFGKYKGFNITDNTIREYEQATGRVLTAEQRKAVTYAVRMINNTTSPEAREKILNAIEDYNDLRNRIISNFPPEAQQQAGELFTQSFAQASSLGPLAALHALSVNKLDVRKLKGYDATYMVDLMNQADAQVKATEAALDNFQNFLNATSDIADRETVQAMLDNTRNATQQFKRDLDKRAEATLDVMNDIRKQVLADPTIDVPEGFLNNLVEADVAMKKRLGILVDERKSIGENLTDLYNGITQRVTSLRNYRGKGVGYEAGLSRTLEDVFDAHLEGMHLKGKVAYDKVRKAAEQAPAIDMHDAVIDLMEKAGETEMHRFFSPEGQFFAGRMGKITYRVFDDMVKRTIPSEQMAEIREALLSNGYGQELVQSMTDLEIALEMQRLSPDFKPFAKANAYEVDEMRRAFGDYAYRVRNTMPELGREVNKFKTNLDNLIRKQDGATYTLLEQARRTYRDEIGDRLRSRGTLRNLDASREGGEKVTIEATDLTRYRYKNVTPLTVFRPISTKITGALQGKPDDQKAIKDMVDNLVTDWADRVDGQSVFDLDSEEGKAKFEAIQNLLTEQVYSDWAERATAVFERVEGPSSLLEGGGYKFKNLADEANITERMMVKVRQNGEVVEVPLVNLGDMYSEARDITKLLREQSSVRTKYEEFVTSFNDTASVVRKNADNNVAADKDALDALRRFSGDITPDQFYDQFILNGSESKFSTLRDTFIPAVVKTGKSADEAEAMFDKAVRSLVSRGFMNRGDLRPVEGLKMTALDGDKLKVRQFMSPQTMLLDVQENREMLNMILGPDHVNYLRDIADFLDRAASSRVNVEGMVRGYSVNEGLSRLYNISRGMVSPLYVTSEFAVRLASSSGIEVLQLAAGNKDAARIINNMFQYPELVTRTDVDNLNEILAEFVFTELARMGQRELPDYYMPQEGEVNETNIKGQ